MAVEAPVVLSALFFTILAVILASAFLAKRSKPSQDKRNRNKAERPEKRQEKREEPVVHSPVVEKIGAADVPLVLKAEVASVQQTQVKVNKTSVD